MDVGGGLNVKGGVDVSLHKWIGEEDDMSKSSGTFLTLIGDD